MITISIITITKNNDAGLLKTYQTVSRLFELSTDEIKFEWVIKSGDQIISNQVQSILADPLFCGKIIYDNSIDGGIYDAMTKASKRSAGDVLCYMNAGDQLIPDNFFEMIRFYRNFRSDEAGIVVYGESAWDGEVSLLSKYFKKIHPILGRVPSHQAMIFSRNLQSKFEFDPYLKYYADMDWKIRLLKSGIQFHKFDKSVCIGEVGGVSQMMKNIKVLNQRAHEVKYVMGKNYNSLWSWVYFSLFYIWNFRKIGL